MFCVTSILLYTLQFITSTLECLEQLTAFLVDTNQGQAKVYPLACPCTNIGLSTPNIFPNAHVNSNKMVHKKNPGTFLQSTCVYLGSGQFCRECLFLGDSDGLLWCFLELTPATKRFTRHTLRKVMIKYPR